MFVAAVIIYTVAAFAVGPLWPIELIKGKAGPLGVILVIGWIILLIASLG